MDISKEIDGRFKITGEIAQRPNCTVYRATDSTLGGREVAVKIFVDRPNGNLEWIDSFKQEAGKLRGASHEVLVPIIAAGCFEDDLYLAMELIEGGSLYERLKQSPQPMPIGDAVTIAADLAVGLAEIHEAGTLHGHLDSRAVLFKDSRARLAGYCPDTIERILKSVTTQGRISIDTAYISPEQVQGAPVDGRADIYGLASLLYEMITGQKPFPGKNPLQVAMARLSQPPVSPQTLNKEIPPLLDAALRKALAKDPAERFQTMREFADALASAKGGKAAPLFDGAPERMDEASATIAVSMSTDAIKDMLRSHEAKTAQAPASIPSVSDTVTGMAGISGGGALDVAATAMGMPATGAQPGSLMIIQGGDKGRRFSLDKTQSMIGSDSSCDICVSGKNVARRFALINRDGSDYSIEALGGGAITINGKQEQAEKPFSLKRGDTVKVGDSQLRFIAPGEVFTLHDAVADRAIDRPPSKTPLIVAVLAALLIVLCGGGVYVYTQKAAAKQAAAKRAEQAKEAQREKRVAELIKEGDAFLKSGTLNEPSGANALERFQAVLDINPDDGYAKRRAAEIRDRLAEREQEAQRRALYAQKVQQLLADAERYVTSGAYVTPPGKNARETYQEVLKIDSENAKAREGIAKIDAILGDIVGRVNTLLARGREYRTTGQYVLPVGENAYEMFKQVLSIDPENKEARDALYDMAAERIFAGDQAKNAADYKEMKTAYLTAKALGADPRYVDARAQGAELIGSARSEVIIVDRKEPAYTGPVDDRYLNPAELDRRIELLRLAAPAQGARGAQSGRTFKNIGSGVRPGGK